MASTAEIAQEYFDALSAHDLDRALACWRPGAIDRFIGGEELVAPEGIRNYFESLYAAFPDFAFEILSMTTSRNRCAVQWRVRATFAGPGTFQGFEPNHARAEIEGCDVVTVKDGLIEGNEAYVDSGSVARSLGFLPPTGSTAEARLTRLANMRTRIHAAVHGVSVERIAPGVCIARGGFPFKTFNVYLIEDGHGVTVFDAGIKAMGPALNAACARMGGATRVVLGHADCDHRGAAPGLGVPVWCHPGERDAAESESAFRPYWHMDQLDPHGRLLLGRLLPTWDGGAVEVAGTVSEGDEVAGFEVVELPGHAPGLIGLFRREDGLALVSDCIYTLDPQTGRKGAARVPHRAFDDDVAQARESIRKLAALAPSVVWAGHADPVTGDVQGQLERAAAA